MINPFASVNWNPGLKDKRKFAKALMMGFPGLAAALLVLRRLAVGSWHAGPFLWLGGVGLALGLLFYLIPAIAKPFYLVWYFIACCLGFVATNLILCVFFFFGITPLGLFMRLIGRDPLTKGFDKKAASYWDDAKPITDKAQYERQF